ncbi:VOC family protein [Glaciihabitans sp. dw_435]|uniref:VOC family protein n=1 Tax=Glaciihabitans sp. dw_435 TaxID=2720081 RepID=UPI001BD38728|nr:VOC family protein [Glaciihabitans sp. dw_435]
MERVLGIGGFFFAARDPAALTDWYATNLGVEPPPDLYGGDVWHQQAGPTAFAAMDGDEPTLEGKTWAINFRVRSLDAMVDQLRQRGIRVTVDDTEYPIGRFATLTDPEGNAVQLWEASETSAR